MGFLFPSPKMPSVPAPTPPPVVPPAPEPAKITEEEKKKARRGRTSRRTILTSPLGLMEEAPLTRKTLLGT